jgi:hypothetical protein
VKSGKLRGYFNHSNAARDENDAARKSIEARGFRVLDEVYAFDLSRGEREGHGNYGEDEYSRSSSPCLLRCCRS